MALLFESITNMHFEVVDMWLEILYDEDVEQIQTRSATIVPNKNAHVLLVSSHIVIHWVEVLTADLSPTLHQADHLSANRNRAEAMAPPAEDQDAALPNNATSNTQVLSCHCEALHMILKRDPLEDTA